MSKWCGDENCLQCVDKEPDPYVHLPREDYDALRAENARLRARVNETQRQRAEAVVEEFKDAAIDIYEAVEPDSIDQSLFVRFEKALDALDRLAREGVK